MGSITDDSLRITKYFLLVQVVPWRYRRATALIRVTKSSR
jgi:hypothetical protein